MSKYINLHWFLFSLIFTIFVNIQNRNMILFLLTLFLSLFLFFFISIISDFMEVIVLRFYKKIENIIRGIFDAKEAYRKK